MTRDELDNKFSEALATQGVDRMGGPCWTAFRKATHGLCDNEESVCHAGGTLEQRVHALEETISALGRALR